MRLLILTLMIALPQWLTAQNKTPEAVMPVPTEDQIGWQRMETYAFIHFGLNTFNDREWGYGDSNPATFFPKQLDCNQWVETLKAAGMQGVILTAKHHDGFCLWPTRTTEYCIRNSPYKEGRGDIVGELAEACRQKGLKMGLYLSPWDRNHAAYGSQEYVDYYHSQLKELLSRYGDIFEVWLDGANGGDGWYGGACEKRTIDRRTYYQFDRIQNIINSLQPHAIVFSDGGPGCRWVGNEDGHAGETCWSMIPSNTIYPGYPDYKQLQYGFADGDQWTAAECDVSIRPGWFYHPEEDDKVKTVDELTDLYYRSVGHNATLLLNFPVDRNGRIHPTDSANAVGMRNRISQELAFDLLKGTKPRASSSRGKAFRAKMMTDGNPDTYWAAPDDTTEATIEFRLSRPATLQRMMLQEYIPLGQRIDSFRVEFLSDGEWHTIDTKEQTTTIGYKRLLRFEPIRTNRLRLWVRSRKGCPCLSTVAAY